MFGALKKRLKEALQKASAIVKDERKEDAISGEKAWPAREEPVFEKEETKPEEAGEEKAKEEKEVAVSEEIHEKEAEKTAVALAEEEPKIKDSTEETPALLPERKIDKEIVPVSKNEPAEKELASPKREKKSIFGSLTKKFIEKKLSDEEIEKILAELRKALLENDVAFEVTEKLTGDVKQALSGKSVKRGEVEETIKDSLKSSMLGVLSQEKIDLEGMINFQSKPFLVLFFGFNGVGKTTSIAKIAHRYEKYHPVIAAGDTFRAASIEQLEEHGRRIGFEVVKHKYGADSAAVIFDAVKHAEAVGSKLVLADTAGRSHSNVNLIDELKKVVRVNKPDLKVLVLDSITGNDIVEQSKLFADAVGVDAVILTKADVYEKGGAALSAGHTINKPIIFLGTGQGYSDLKEFDPEEIVKNLLE